MKLSVSFKHMSPNDAAKKHVDLKSSKLKRYFSGRIQIVWNLEPSPEGYTAHCHLVGPQMDYFGEAEGDSLISSVDLAFQRIERQIRRQKEIKTGHRAKRAASNRSAA